ncbi:DUF5060 domain-containing protein [Bacteroidota bacterium]
MKYSAFIILLFVWEINLVFAINPPIDVEKWGMYEITLKGPVKGNPFHEVQLQATFTHANKEVRVDGFYDGEGIFKIRFMPDLDGEWKYITKSNNKKLNGKSGSLTCIAPSSDNHGPVFVSNTYHFKYADGSCYFPFGTTAYAWNHMPESIRKQTLKTLAEEPYFNKMRMCVFPKSWSFYIDEEPEYFPYEGEPGSFDFSRFKPIFFRELEQRILEMQELGIEVDLILFHPYDEGRWGFDRMSQEQDDQYLKYLITRVSAFRNVWWSLANEWDFMKEKEEADFERFANIILEKDPYHRLRSIHNGHTWYDHTRSWITHASIQHRNPKDVEKHRIKYGKPIIHDEVSYEGNIQYSWGDLTAEEMSNRVWIGVCLGGYVTHGETYFDEDTILWWSKGGVLKGKSHKRIEFLSEILEDNDVCGLTPVHSKIDTWNDYYFGASGEDFFLFYFGSVQPAQRWIELPERHNYRLDVFDTWNMNIIPLEGKYIGRVLVPLPGKPYIAIRAIRIEDN